jgi:DNA replication licensing factor MCM6
MLRLSEAIARMYLLEEVEPERLKEAFRLLSKSIIRVEQPGIQLEDDALEAEIEAVSWGPTELKPSLSGGADQQQMDVDVDANQKNIKLTYDEYKLISNMLVYYIRKKKEEIDTKSNGTNCLRSYQHTDGDSLVFKGEEITGVHKSELISWYLNEVESLIENEQQLIQQNALVEKIINRSVNYVSILS